MSYSPCLDRFGRRINYLRLSVTDHCNLRCAYCSRMQRDFIPHREILRYEEHLELIAAARRLGVDKVRLTGGEPFARKDFLPFLTGVMEKFPELDLRLTTNGTLIPEKMQQLKDIGLSRLNISLDTLDRQRYARLCGRDLFSEVWRSIENGLDAGLGIKINVVAMRGVNDDELGAFLDLARRYPLDVRFIEFMPLTDNGTWDRSRVWSAGEILAEAKEYVELTPVSESKPNSGPARMYQLNTGLGRLGVISPLTEHFCATCNRFRITSDGRLRTCLFSNREYRLRPILRSQKLGLEQVVRVMRMAARQKPMGHEILRQRCAVDPGGRTMAAIGG
ncbi:MAG: GTP 3',8-cyclase MoaA [Desulfohalobiaceae bacterium]|nr:GTP 3',8-cyclase MoaA [Desulfohalobiaceae bacterium]